MLTLAIEPHKNYIKINSKCIKIGFEVHQFLYTDIFQPNLVAMRGAVPSENNAHTHTNTQHLLIYKIITGFLKNNSNDFDEIDIFCT